jgi:hypothetical protein
MKEQLISFETAKLAKERGFTMFDKNFKSALVDTRNNDIQRYSFYREFAEFNYTRDEYPMRADEPRIQFQFEGQTNSTNIFGLKNSYESPNDDTLCVHCFLAPTQSLLQKWLREVHGIDLWCERFSTNERWIWQCPKVNRERLEGSYDTYEQALEKGLQEALKLIK